MYVDYSLWISENGGHHLSGREGSLRLHRSWFSWRSLFFRLLLGLRSIPVEPCSVDRQRTTEKLLQIAFKQCHTLLWSGLTVALTVPREKRHTHHTDSFLMSKISCSIWPTRSFEMSTESAISHTFNRQFVHIKSWSFVTLSFVVAILGAPGRDSRHSRRCVCVYSFQRSLVSPLDSSFKNKNRITSR